MAAPLATLARRCIPAFLLAGLVACSGNGNGNSATSSGSTAATPPPASSTPTPPARKGPPTAQLTLRGATGLSGPLGSTATVQCSLPQLDGTAIRIDTTAADGATAIVVVVHAGKVTVIASMGAGAQARSRSFTGQGVHGFDAGSGASIDTSLTETTPSGTASQGIGALSGMTGTIDCGNSQPGRTTARVTGDVAAGHLDGVPNPVKVACHGGATPSVSIAGIVTAGTTPVLVFVVVQPDSASAGVSTATGATFYTAKATGLGVLSGTGVTVKADLTENTPSGGVRHTLHVEGAATCGVIS